MALVIYAFAAPHGFHHIQSLSETRRDSRRIGASRTVRVLRFYPRRVKERKIVHHRTRHPSLDLPADGRPLPVQTDSHGCG